MADVSDFLSMNPEDIPESITYQKVAMTLLLHLIVRIRSVKTKTKLCDLIVKPMRF